MGDYVCGECAYYRGDRMDGYTYADVIIDPEDPRVEIGKEYYFGDNVGKLLWGVRTGWKTEVLHNVFKDAGIYEPFYNGRASFSCIIRKKEPPYRERQAEWVEKVGLKAGDKVRILRKFDDCEQGFHCGMNSEGKMDCLVGKVVEVWGIDARSICLYNEDKSDWWVWPYFCLEKVEPEYVPFDLSKEEDRTRLRGAWVRHKQNPERENLITGLGDETVDFAVYFGDVAIGTGVLLENFEFVDGSPCGKLVEAEA